MTLTFLAAGEPTIDTSMGRAGTIGPGLTEKGRNQIKNAANYVGKPALVLTSYEPDTRESARILLENDFGVKTHFLPELQIDFPRPDKRPIALWNFLQSKDFWKRDQSIVVLVRSDVINPIVRGFCVNYQNFLTVQRLMDCTFFSYGNSISVHPVKLTTRHLN